LYAVVFPLYLQFAFWGHYTENVDRAGSVRDELIGREQDNSSSLIVLSPIRYSKLLPFPAELAALSQFPSLAAPFGCDERVERFLKITKRYAPEYFFPAQMDIYCKADVERNAADILKSEYLILPAGVTESLKAINPNHRASLYSDRPIGQLYYRKKNPCWPVEESLSAELASSFLQLLFPLG